jgi:hypothetical protein
MMSSETSTEVQRLPAGQDADRGDGAAFQPWQLFTLAGLVGAAVVAFVAGNQPHSVRIALIFTILAAASIGLAALYVLAPFIGHARMRRPEVIGGRTRAALEREKTLVLRSIKELEFDRAMGKLSDKDFEEMSLRLRSRATRILRQLDEGSGYRDEIAREIERRVSTSPSVPTAPDGALDAPRRTAAEEPAVSATCACGTMNDPDARFCKGCGARREAA